MSQPEDDQPEKRALREIARTLDVPIESFLGRGSFNEEQPTEVEQEQELLRLFRLVRNGQARRRCLSFVRVLAERPSSDGSAP